MKIRIPTPCAMLLGVGLSLPLVAQTYLVNDAFTDTDRIGGTDGSSGTPSVSAATSTNTQWVVSQPNQMVASASGLKWTLDAASSRLAIGYFPTVTVGTNPVTFTLNFTTGTFGDNDNNIRIALVDGSPNGYLTADSFSTSNNAETVGDTGYGFFSASSNVGGGTTTDLSVRTYERAVLTSESLLGSSGEWSELVRTDGATGYIDQNSAYSLAVTMQMVGADLSIGTSLTGPGLSGFSTSIVDDASPVTTFDQIAIRMGGGSAQFTDLNLTSFTVTTIPEPSMAALFAGLGGILFMIRRRRS